MSLKNVTRTGAGDKRFIRLSDRVRESRHVHLGVDTQIALWLRQFANPRSAA